MFKTILVPTDGSPMSDKAIGAAIEFARQTGARIIGISVADPTSYIALAEDAIAYDVEAYEMEARQTAQSHVQKVAQAASAANVPCDTVTALSLNPHEEIIKAADSFHCDAIFMASHGPRSMHRLFAGSQTQKVLAHSTVPVMVFR